MVMHREVTTLADGAVEARGTRDICRREDASDERHTHRQNRKIPRHLFVALIDIFIPDIQASYSKRPNVSGLSGPADRTAILVAPPSGEREITGGATFARACGLYACVYLYYLPEAKKSRKFRSTCRGNRCHLFVCSVFGCEMQRQSLSLGRTPRCATTSVPRMATDADTNPGYFRSPTCRNSNYSRRW